MKEYRVYFTARVYDNITVYAESEEQAEEIALQMTSALDHTAEVDDWELDFVELEDETAI